MRWSRYSISCQLPSHEEAIGVESAKSVGRCLHALDAPILSPHLPHALQQGSL